MKKITEKPCQRISYHSQNFANEVIESLHTDRVFVLTDLPEELKKSMQELFVTGDDLFDHLHEYSQEEYPAIIEPNNVRGLFRPQKFPIGCNNGARFFIAMNNNGGMNNEQMPNYQDSPVMSKAASVFNSHTDTIVDRIIQAITSYHDLDANQLKQAILGSACVGLTRYYPITQNRAAQLFKNNALAVKDDQIEQFVQHRDINPFTILAYRNGPRGLTVHDKETNTFVPLTVDCGDEPYLIIFTGRILKELTNGNIRALKHQVVTTPEEQHAEAQMDPHDWRFTLAKFTFFNHDQLAPLNTTTHGMPIQPPKPRKHERQYPMSQGQFFMNHLASAADIRDKAKPAAFPAEIAGKYPTHVRHEDLYVAQLGADSVGEYKQ